MTALICWLVHGPVFQSPKGLTSGLPSVRYRVIMPVRALRPRYRHRIAATSGEALDQNRETILASDIIVFSKTTGDGQEALAQEAKRLGRTIVFDICDNHFEDAVYAAYYRTLCALAHQVVCNSVEMARIAAPYCKVQPVVIEDPCEGPRGAARFAPADVLKVLWFGHPLNLPSVEHALPELQAVAERRPMALSLLTIPVPELDALVRRAGSQHGLTVSGKRWSLDAQWRELADCDVVVIPSLQNDKTRAKSANRLIEGLWAGRPVVAHSLPAYEPFARWTPVGPSLSESFDRLFDEAAEAVPRIEAAQRHIEMRFTPGALGPKWQRMFDQLTGAEASA